MGKTMTVTEMFNDLIEKGYLDLPKKQNIDSFPGAFDYVPSITSYGLPDATISSGIHPNAKLEQRSSRNS